MAKIIGVTGLKGGAGRTTVAVNLAASLSARGPTLLVDCDLPQGSASSWHTVRQETRPGDALELATAQTHDDLLEVIETQAANYRYVILDTPPRVAETTRAAMLLSNLLLIPMAPTAMEAWALQDVLDVLNEAAATRPTIKRDTRILWTRYRGRTKSAGEISAAVRADGDLRELKTRLGFRVAYPDAVEHGLGASEWHDQAARDEARRLCDEVAALLRRR